MRGKVSTAKVFSFGLGITPAYAGKRRKDHSGGHDKQDHPRLCGEKHYTPFGNICQADHPRLCGEKSWTAAERVIPSGSPPPMRGKERSDCSETAAFRITPAYAGKSGSLLFSVSVSGDHPRLCGEKDAVQSGDPARLGSPPPMRGKGIMQQPKTTDNRITPAYAGKRWSDHSCLGIF